MALSTTALHVCLLLPFEAPCKKVKVCLLAAVVVVKPIVVLAAQVAM